MNWILHLKSQLLLLQLLLLQLLLLVQAENPCLGHSSFRNPEDSDLQVSCGSQTVVLSVLLCPVYFNGYNESLLALNSRHGLSQCGGAPDWTADPPRVTFNFSITEQGISACSNTLTVSQETGTGVFSDFASVQFVHISGTICSEDLGSGTISYHQELMYKFSCHYPLQYLLNNTHMSVAGAQLAVRDNNGSFISTLSIRLYSDASYSSVLQIPAGGLELKTRIFVEVKASNLSSRFNVLLDRCYATTSLLPDSSSLYDLLVGCSRDGQTVVQVNGEQQEARFSFEAFRFVQSDDDTSSTYFVHCSTRLCDRSFCPTLLQNCSSGSRRRRAVGDDEDTVVSDVATVTSGPVTVRPDRGRQDGSGGSSVTGSSNTVLAVSFVAAVGGAICITLVVVTAYRKFSSNKTAPFTHH